MGRTRRGGWSVLLFAATVGDIVYPLLPMALAVAQCLRLLTSRSCVRLRSDLS